MQSAEKSALRAGAEEEDAAYGINAAAVGGGVDSREVT